MAPLCKLLPGRPEDTLDAIAVKLAPEVARPARTTREYPILIYIAVEYAFCVC
jgi:hypothetical protein